MSSPIVIGSLVRPKILKNVEVHCDSGMEDSDTDWMSKSLNTNRSMTNLDRTTFYQPINGLFTSSQLLRGDTTENIETCYVGQVVSFITKDVEGKACLANKNNIHLVHEKIKKAFGNKTNLRISLVGLKLFRGVELTSSGTYVATNQWEPTMPGKHRTWTWFYRPWDLVRFEEIVRYESIQPGNVILFENSSGFVAKKTKKNNKTFWSHNSWTPYSFRLLNQQADGFFRFHPTQKFSIRRASDPVEPDPLPGVDNTEIKC